MTHNSNSEGDDCLPGGVIKKNAGRRRCDRMLKWRVRLLTIAGVRVTQGLLGVQSDTDVPSVGRRRAGAGARALVVTAAANHGALRPRRPAGPGAFYCKTHNTKQYEH